MQDTQKQAIDARRAQLRAFDEAPIPEGFKPVELPQLSFCLRTHRGEEFVWLTTSSSPSIPARVKRIEGSPYILQSETDPAIYITVSV